VILEFVVPKDPSPADLPLAATKVSPEILKRLAAEIGITDINDQQWQKLTRYCELAWDWNTKVNLTRHTTPELFVHRDLLDSVQLAKLLRRGEEVLDVGTGGGVPGILLAILREDLEVSLCDSVGKKAKVAQDIVDKLELNVLVYPMSMSKVLEEQRFDSVVARGVGPLVRLCGWLNDQWHKIGRLLAIKGPRWVQERAEARHRGLLRGVSLRRMAAYPMTSTESESVILQVARPSSPFSKSVGIDPAE
jgi:16S rRNA (guanine527-N7)-methyltransferase